MGSTSMIAPVTKAAAAAAAASKYRIQEMKLRSNSSLQQMFCSQIHITDLFAHCLALPGWPKARRDGHHPQWYKPGELQSFCLLPAELSV